MEHIFEATIGPGNRARVATDFVPDECRVCHRTGDISRVPALCYLSPPNGPNKGARLQSLFRCPGNECGVYFIVEYALVAAPLSTGVNPYTKLRTLPSVPKVRQIADNVVKVSSSYVEILTQATAAEEAGLHHIAGMGFRKALEFLIKDYCIHLNPGKADDIKKCMLGPTINNYVTDSRIKECAKRAAWLGNDETHYVRVWQQKDVEDLKRLLRLTENWIDSEFATFEYLKTMP